MNTHTTDLFALAAAATFFGFVSLLAQTASAQQTPQPATTPQIQQTQSNASVPHSARTKVIGVELFSNSSLDLDNEEGADPDFENTSGLGFSLRFGVNVLKTAGFQLIPEARLQYSSLETEIDDTDIEAEVSSLGLSAGIRAGGFLDALPLGGFAFVHAGVASVDTRSKSPTRGANKGDGKAKTLEAGFTFNYALSDLVGIGVVASKAFVYDDDGTMSWTNLGLHTEFRF